MSKFFISKIKTLLKSFKLLLKPYEAQPLTEFNNKDIENIDFSLKRKKNLKRKRKFYIIRRSPGAGLFSNFIYVLNHLNIASSCKFYPVIDMENYTTIYNERQSINKNFNSWNYFFDLKKKIDLKKVYNNEVFFLSSNKFYKKFSHEISNNFYRKLFNKYFKIKKSHLEFVKYFSNKYFKREKILAIHYRGTSYKTSASHPFPPTIKQSKILIKNIIKKYKFTKIFLCTEDLSYLNSIKKEFKDITIYLKDSYRSKKDDAFKNYPRKLHRYKLGKEILIESLLISKCDGFLYCNTNVSEFVKFLDNKKKIKYFLIENGFNSSNEYLAKWLWSYKNTFPKLFGGFEDKVNVKNI